MKKPWSPYIPVKPDDVPVYWKVTYPYRMPVPDDSWMKGRKL